MKSTIMRIYMPISAQVKGERTFWQKLMGVPLSSYLVKEAKQFGIEQAILQRVNAGYLKGKELIFEQSEVVPPGLPLCVELIDVEIKLKSFREKYKDQLVDCRTVIFESAEIIK